MALILPKPQDIGNHGMVSPPGLEPGITACKADALTAKLRGRWLVAAYQISRIRTERYYLCRPPRSVFNDRFLIDGTSGPRILLAVVGPLDVDPAIVTRILLMERDLGSAVVAAENRKAFR